EGGGTMPPCILLRDWYESGKSIHLCECSLCLIFRPRFLHFTLNHYKPGLVSSRSLRIVTEEQAIIAGLRGPLSCCAMEILEAALKSCNDVWHMWTVSDVSPGAPLVTAAMSPEKTIAAGEPGATGVVPPPDALVPAPRFAAMC